MKKLFGFVFSVLLFASCSKDTNKCAYSDSTASATQAERSTIENYLSANSLSAIEHSSGFFYTVNAPGSGTIPNVCSVIRVKYTGHLFNGNLFDSYQGSSGISFTLGQLIVGWQKGLQAISSGGIITLYIPPSLGYGPIDRRDGNGNIVIPANSYLKFTIDLMDVQ